MKGGGRIELVTVAEWEAQKSPLYFSIFISFSIIF